MEKVREVAICERLMAPRSTARRFNPLRLIPALKVARPFVVKLASTESQAWPADKTIAQQENGVAVPLSCEMGICGACLTPVITRWITGTAYSQRQRKRPNPHVALCCSRSHSAELVIGL